MKNRIYLASPHMSDEGYEQKFIKEAFDTNWIAPFGANIDSFEREVAELVGSKYSAALASGTAALHLALKAVGVQEGDIVFCQDLTFAATVNPVIYEKGIPVFIDSELDTWNLDPELLEEAFRRYTPKAVIVVHLYGISAKINQIQDICKRYNTPLIEDAAESFGTVYKGKYTGTFGDYGIYSFNGNKVITTAGGGMVVSNNQRGIEKIRFWATQARENVSWYQHEEVGYNYRMSNILAGIGRGQLKVLAERVRRKREIYSKYKESFKNISSIQMGPDNLEQGDNSNHWLSVITLRTDKVKPMDIVQELERHNIEARLTWKPMHLQPVFKNYDFIGTGISDEIFNRGLCLPSDTKMTDADIDRVVEIVSGMVEG